MDFNDLLILIGIYMNKDRIIYLIMAFLIAYTHTISAGKSFEFSAEDTSVSTLESMCCKEADIAST